MLQQLLDELAALLASVEDAGGDMTDEQAERADELNKQIDKLKENEEIRKRSAAFLAPDGKTPAFIAAKTPDTYERAFDHYLRTGQVNSDLIQFRDQNTGTPADGGYLVPDEFLQKMVEVRKAYGGLANEAEVVSTSRGGPLEFPTVDDTANVGSITAEATAFSDGADLVFDTVTLGAYKYTSSGAGTTTPLRVSTELLQDSAFDVQALVSRKLGERIERAQAVDWITGDGSGEPQGLFQPTKDMDVDNADTITYVDLADFEASLDPEYEAGAKWLMSKGTWNVVRKIVDDDGRPLVQANSEAGIGTMPGANRTLLGYPVVIDQAATTFGAATGPSTNIALGNFREGYLIRRVAPLTVVVNPWTRANEGQVEFIAYERADGVVQNKAAYKLLANL